MPPVWWFEHGRLLMSVYNDDLTLDGDKDTPFLLAIKT